MQAEPGRLFRKCWQLLCPPPSGSSSLQRPHSGDSTVTAGDSMRGHHLLKGQWDSKAFWCSRACISRGKGDA